MVMEISSTESGSDHLNGANFRLVNYSYRPFGNFWQDQGYIWSHGNVNVTKGTLMTPFKRAVEYNLTDALFSAGSYPNPADPYNCSVVDIKGVNIIRANSDGSVSGNGMGTLALESTRRTKNIPNVTHINITVSSPLPDFKKALRESINTSLNNSVVESPHCGNIHFNRMLSNDNSIWLTIDPGPTNVTVSRQITDISLSAY
jgi:hypothetical protein